VPDVTGLSASKASKMLRSAGLSPVKRERTVTSQDQDGAVIEQRPAAGREVDKGDSVVIVVGRFQQTTTQQPPPATPPGQ
jgi:beta-lactam-binding protein with PASTA domain